MVLYGGGKVDSAIRKSHLVIDDFPSSNFSSSFSDIETSDTLKRLCLSGEVREEEPPCERDRSGH